MQLTFTRAEYWILELVVEGSWPLTYLASRNIDEMFNRPGHGLDRPALIDCLEGLFVAGLIEGGVSPGDLPASPLSRDRIIAALDEAGPREERPYTYYQLTAKGASQWEAFAKPNWRHFVLDDSDCEAKGGQLTCMDRKWLGVYLARSSIAEGPIDQNSVKYQEIGPWEATYWKVLRQGWRVEFCRAEEETGYNSYADLIARELLFRGFCEIRDGWYRWR